MNKMDFDELTMNESLEIEGGGLVEDLGRLTGKVLYYFCKAVRYKREQKFNNITIIKK